MLHEMITRYKSATGFESFMSEFSIHRDCDSWWLVSHAFVILSFQVQRHDDTFLYGCQIYAHRFQYNGITRVRGFSAYTKLSEYFFFFIFIQTSFNLHASNCKAKLLIPYNFEVCNVSFIERSGHYLSNYNNA